MKETGVIAFYAFCPQGLNLGKKLVQTMDGALFAPERLLQTGLYLPDAAHGLTENYMPRTSMADDFTAEGVRPFHSLGELLAEQFHSYAAHVFIGAAGIAVRAIAPHLRGKTVDPAVVVCEIHGRHVISLLSGHVGGANALTRVLAERVGGEAIITTATDSEGLPAIDILADIAHCHVADPSLLKLVSAAILAGQTPNLHDPSHFLDLSESERARVFRATDELPPASAKIPAVVVGVHTVPPAPGRLRLYARRLHAGIGYRRNVPATDLLAALRRALAEAGLAEESLASLSTADIKRDDPAIREVARQLDLPLRFFSAEALAAVPVPNPSPKAAEVLNAGPLSVAEGSALLSAGPGADEKPTRLGMPHLILPKRTETAITIAVAVPHACTSAVAVPPCVLPSS